MLVGGADDGEPPPVRTRDAAQLASSASNSSSSPTGSPLTSAVPRDDAVGEERAPGRREEIALVAPQREEREAVAAVRVDERARHPLLADRLRDGLPNGRSQK